MELLPEISKVTLSLPFCLKYRAGLRWRRLNMREQTGYCILNIAGIDKTKVNNIETSAVMIKIKKGLLIMPTKKNY